VSSQAATGAELARLRQEALGYGYTLAADVEIEAAREAVERIRVERAGRPPCYRRSYSRNSARCRLCLLATDCAGSATAATAVGEVAAETCQSCTIGLLLVELKDDAGAVLDYGCQTPGCTHTLLRQSAWRPPIQPDEKQKCDEQPAAPDGEPDRPATGKPVTPRKPVPPELVAKVRVAVAGGASTRKAICAAVPGQRSRVLQAVRDLLGAGELTISDSGAICVVAKPQNGGAASKKTKAR